MKSYPENMNGKMAYDMTQSGSILKLRDAVGQIMQVTAYVLRDDTNNRGEEQEVLSIRDENGTVYATSSKPFIREFKKVLDYVHDDLTQVQHIEITSGVSKSGRTYISMRWVD